jgi:hypothetical protein
MNCESILCSYILTYRLNGGRIGAGRAGGRADRRPGERPGRPDGPSDPGASGAARWRSCQRGRRGSVRLIALRDSCFTVSDIRV